ncbi:hypothetical protein CLV92_11275 [Kineococcus xinjiangensis]|uniref:Uncharacterized protein n=1 Tax=Kineococcus xinjiangensis TaxID=512762 RepID=A0A2S6IFA5_9ACTN|nr:hypothetical protein CLV92_11275 [Kineococcus xinjiangensis]
MSGREDDEKNGIPNPETGVGIGASDEPSTFEPEETAEDA